MNYFESVFLGLVQGLTEFLPISSSGHLVLFQKLFGIEQGALTFDVWVHFGTLLAVVVVFWRDLVEIMRAPFGRLSRLILAGAIPTAIIGLSLQDTFEKIFSSGATLGVEFIITGLILWWAEVLPTGHKDMRQTGYWDAVLIGTLQGAAILPAISRSGLTIAGGLFRGLSREWAARYSFLISIPVIFGATLLEARKLIKETGTLAITSTDLVGVVVAAASGYLAIKFMLALIVHRSLRVFSIYVFMVGGLIIFDQLVSRVFFPPLF